jgi:hypothetical protein
MSFEVNTCLPDDTVMLAALGRVAIRHGHVEYCLRMTLKSLKNENVGKALGVYAPPHGFARTALRPANPHAGLTPGEHPLICR